MKKYVKMVQANRMIGLFQLSQRSFSDSNNNTGWFSNFTKNEPIVYETNQILPFRQDHFYSVAIDVDRYHLFVPYMTSSRILQNTHKTKIRNGVKHGKFDAETAIGFKGLVNFSYISTTTYKEPSYIFTVSGKQADGSISSMIFDELYSTWEISEIPKIKGSSETSVPLGDSCQVTYKISMTFANSLYSSVTRQFFDVLAKHMQKSF